MKRLVLFVFLVCSAVNVLADSPPNRCQFLSLMISNNTKETCRLIDRELKHGKMSSSTQVPALIMPGNSSYPFEMMQLFYGPDIVLTYECGAGNVVTFESIQRLCVLKHGPIYGSVLYSQNLHAKQTKEPGSYIWGQHGSINWTISSY
jgi:hypothetical protein